jgi:hypothetical protein
MKILVIDIGGSNVKFLASGRKEARKIPSGKDLTPQKMVEGVRKETEDWEYEVISLGYPGLTAHDGPDDEPMNLGKGWVGFDFEAAFGCPVKVVNDAIMQALGSYEGGRMLFLGLGTAVGSCFISEKTVVNLELGRLPFRDARIMDYLGRKGLEQLGEEKWRQAVYEVVSALHLAFVTDYLVLGGGNAERVQPLPEGARLGGNEMAFEGGFRLWETTVAPLAHVAPSHVWKLIL